MKKMILALIALTIALTPLLALAADSPVNQIINNTEVVEWFRRDVTKEVIPPTVEIVKNTETVTELQEELKTIYRLTIRYVYLDNTPAAEPHEEMLQTNTQFTIPSPEIEDCTTVNTVVTGVMPSRDMTMTVIYLKTANEEEETEIIKEIFDIITMKNVISFEDYETPLGLGFVMSNVGICFE